MHILIEGENYSLDLLENLFDDPKFYKVNGSQAVLTSVGYYHSFDKNGLVFMLPKVFMKEGSQTVLGMHKDMLVNMITDSVKHKEEYHWLRLLSVYFYNSLLEYRRRFYNNAVVYRSETFELNTNLGIKDYSFLDVLLSFISFHKKNKSHILFKQVKLFSDYAKKPGWEKTIRRSVPILTEDDVPFYIKISDKKKDVNTEEELIIYYFSVLNHLNKEYHLNLRFSSAYPLIKGRAFEALRFNGLSKLRKIKHRYFNDVSRRMYVLCEMYFSQYDKGSVRKKREDFIAVSNYNLIFEDMVDKLFSDDLKQYDINGITAEKLKHNEDGKIIDHIYSYQSLIDTSDIFYIGDSKYYKSDNEAGRNSKYKQITYAKNVIQFNIDLLNKRGEEGIKPLRYRDRYTEGYNISPNFFIYGYIDNPGDYDNHSVEKKGHPVISYHFRERLFDRDTLFVHQYKINFLYVLKSYTAFNKSDIEKFRREVKKTFRDNFISFFNDPSDCQFSFYSCSVPQQQKECFINENFRNLNGKCFLTLDKKLILAIHESDNSLDYLNEYLEKIIL